MRTRARSPAGSWATNTQFAYQAILGVGYNIDTMFRINLEGRFYGTTNPTFQNTGVISGVPFTATTSPQNYNFSLMASLQVKFGAPAVGATAAGAGRPGAVVHGVLRLGPLEPVGPGAQHDQAGV